MKNLLEKCWWHWHLNNCNVSFTHAFCCIAVYLEELTLVDQPTQTLHKGDKYKFTSWAEEVKIAYVPNRDFRTNSYTVHAYGKTMNIIQTVYLGEASSKDSCYKGTINRPRKISFVIRQLKDIRDQKFLGMKSILLNRKICNGERREEQLGFTIFCPHNNNNNNIPLSQLPPPMLFSRKTNFNTFILRSESRLRFHFSSRFYLKHFRSQFKWKKIIFLNPSFYLSFWAW